ncbi:MAG TPA: helix-turn-helix transcriptional regulator [Propionibacteriaceae bacterium]
MDEPRGPKPRPGLVAARKSLGMTQEEIAEKVGVASTTWARWERGVQGVRQAYRSRIARLCGATPDQVRSWIDDAGDVKPRPWIAAAELMRTPLADIVDLMSELWRWEVDAARRRLLAALPLVPAFVSEWLLDYTYRTPDDASTYSGRGPSVGEADVHRIHEALQAFTQMDHQFGGGLVRGAVVDYLATQVHPLIEGRYTAKVGAELMTAAAGITRLAGWQAFDLGRQGLAQLQFGHSLRLAKAGGDQLTASWVLATMAQQACDLREPDPALRLASAARDAGKAAHAGPRVTAMLTVREARATAVGIMLADTPDRHALRRVEHLINRAEVVFASATPQDDEPAWINNFGPAELTAEVGHCWHMAGEQERAAACAEAALRGFGTRFARSAQFNTVHLAQAALHRNELDHSLALARDAVPMANALTSARAVRLVQSFDRELDPYRGEAGVREWRAYMQAELRTRVAA